jgi:chromosome segregation ATPase
MKAKFGAEKARMESEVSQLKSAVNSRDEELLSEKMRYSSLQKEHEKLKQKLNDTTRYLSELATKEETRELRDELKLARDEIEKQKDNISNYEDKLTKAKLTVKEKVGLINIILFNIHIFKKSEYFQMHEIKEGKEALEREKLGKEKLRIEFENYKQMTKSVGEIVEKLEQNASLSAELECAKKLLTGLQEKMSNQQVKYEKQIGDLKESLRQQTDLYTSTKSELEKSEETIRDFQVSLKAVNNSDIYTNLYIFIL